MHPGKNTLTRREWLVLAGAAASSSLHPALAQTGTAWSEIEKAARGQTVYFNAWAGSERTNAYLQWVGAQVLAAHGVKLEHVKITDTADVVKRVRAEKAAGRGAGEGTVDLVWINGENFATMKRDGLLFGPFAESLPNFRYVDTAGKPTTLNDFSVPTEGMESPWGMAQFTLYADSRRLPNPPQSMAELLTLARSQPGRISYPRLPDFTGTTFVKQALIETVGDASVLARPPVDADFARVTAPLWAFLDSLHPQLWRAGKQFPQNPAAIRQMMADGELLLGLTFNPNEAANEIAAKRLPESVVSWQFAKGTIGNTHFVAIPYNARAAAGGQVVANFLLSAQAQARKADIAVWGDPTVLDVARLPAAERARFPSQPLPGQVRVSASTLPEPHAGWVDPLEREWTRRYGS
ncbi:putative thiamine transport system substrate-binding protein [Hydrogenophaga palleronii]|uniref:Thiamine transport system substrate-binding protein n=1 Tax=Hydrogenophaga palleronii TaxID=65655 RepID=A0ABU1WGM3_9BURK|nr:ABC transporter substrate-binding protein [Hydrogenophaga palleronii]MDR7148157.1 putative thiamine transport system substrate-binding protein [Hydrogenophaga palleronii]